MSTEPNVWANRPAVVDEECLAFGRSEADTGHGSALPGFGEMKIKSLGAVSVRKMDGIQETVKFPMPKGLKL